jgi:hypothetical protein
MSHNAVRHFSRAGWVLSLAIIGWSTSASAYTIALTGGSSGGNPGGQPLYEVSGLVQGDAFNVSWGGVSGLSVTGMVIIDSLTATDADVRVMLDNNSTPISGSDPRVTSMGLLIDGFSSLGSSSAGGTYLDDADDSNMPGFAIDACATSGSNCAGGGSGGVPAGLSDDFTLQVNGTFGSTLKLSNFGLKIQGGPNGNSFELAGVPTPKVPEPTSVLLLTAGLGLIAAKNVRREKR